MLFTFPSRYWFTIGLLRVFSLGGWARRIHTGFLVSRATQDSATLQMASCTGLSPSAEELSRTFHSPLVVRCRSPTTPLMPCDISGLGSSPVARHYWGNHILFSLPTGTKMFQFPAFASSLEDDSPSDCRVVPFGNLWIKGYLLLPIAYRSLSRPSSPARA